MTHSFHAGSATAWGERPGSVSAEALVRHHRPRSVRGDGRPDEMSHNGAESPSSRWMSPAVGWGLRGPPLWLIRCGASSEGACERRWITAVGRWTACRHTALRVRSTSTTRDAAAASHACGAWWLLTLAAMRRSVGPMWGWPARAKLGLVVAEPRIMELSCVPGRDWASTSPCAWMKLPCRP